MVPSQDKLKNKERFIEMATKLKLVFEAKDYKAAFGDDDGCWNFFDWFTKDEYLENKSKALFSKVRSLKGSKKFSEDDLVFFKNNCSDHLYDSFTIEDDNPNSGAKFWVSMKSSKRPEYVVCGDGHWEDDVCLFRSKNWSDVRKWFLGK